MNKLSTLPRVTHPKARDGEVILEVLQCDDCGSFAIGVCGSILGKRLTSHKCSGRWTTVFAGRADAADVIAAVQDHQVIPEGNL